MNKKGGIGDLVLDNALYLILLALFVGGMFYFVYSYQNGAAIWEDFYAKEVVKVIDISKPGDEVEINVHKATIIANRNKFESQSERFIIDNVENEVCVKLSEAGRSCYSFFNEVDVIRELKLSGGVEEDGEAVNILVLRISEVGGLDE